MLYRKAGRCSLEASADAHYVDDKGDRCSDSGMVPAFGGGCYLLHVEDSGLSYVELSRCKVCFAWVLRKRRSIFDNSSQVSETQLVRSAGKEFGRR